MEPISSNGTLNIIQKITSKSVVGDAVIAAPEVAIEKTPQSSVEVQLSPAASQLKVDLNLKSRFSSDAEYSAYATNLHSQWITYDEIESGTQRPFASAEDERLSHLTLKELMEESMSLPMVDDNGHSNLNVYGTERGDRINVAKANILIRAQYEFKKSGENVANSLREFKEAVSEKFGVDQSSFDIVYKNGKPTVEAKISSTGKSADPAAIEKIQKMLDSPGGDIFAKKLTDDIESYNNASWQIIDNELTQHIYGPEQNRYLPKNVSKEWLLEGTNYSNVTTTNNLYDKYVDIAAQAAVKYNAALEDGTHFTQSRTDPGILEVTRMREEINLKI